MKRHIVFVVSLVGGLITSCGFSSSYRTSGAVHSKEGVRIRVASSHCYVNRSTQQFPTAVNDDVFHVAIDLQSKNESNVPAVVSPGGFQLLATERGDNVVLRPVQSADIPLSPGENKMIRLDFERRSDLDCRIPLTLEAQGAVNVVGTAVALAPIEFLPSR